MIYPDDYINQIIQGDCLITLKEIPDNSIDACVTDPPYGLTSIQKRFGKEGSAPAQFGKDGSFARLSKGFMGKVWDGSGIEYSVDFWREVLRVLKPGGHLLSFGGSRTYHRMASAIEDAGFEIRDQIMYLYGSGFPKSLDISKAIDKMVGVERKVVGYKGVSTYPDSDGVAVYKNRSKSEGTQVATGGMPKITVPATPDAIKWSGYGTALKPAHEPICVARKPIEGTVAQNVLKWGTGGVNIDGCRVGIDGNDDRHAGQRTKTFAKDGEPISGGEGSPKYNPNNKGRFPANLIHDGSDEVMAGFPNSKSPQSYTRQSAGFSTGNSGIKTIGEPIGKVSLNFGDSGSASRFFYCAKASKSERNAGCEGMEEKQTITQEIAGKNCNRYSMSLYCKLCGKRNDAKCSCGAGWEQKTQPGLKPTINHHPTVKPLSLMRYLITLVSRDDQIIFDPFAGSGSTLIAAKQLGRRYIGCELSEEYCEIARKRIENTGIQGEMFHK